MNSNKLRYLFAGTLAVALFLATSFASAVTINVTYLDGAGEGFNDATLGTARKTAFEFALNIWATQLQGSVAINVNATFDNLGGTSVSAVLGQAGPAFSARDFSGAPVAGTWFSIAEANELNGSDLNGASQEITAQFNTDVDNGVVLGSVNFYYGTDNNPGSNIDFKSVVLHEMGHGLGFTSLINTSNGQWSSGFPDIFGRQLTQTSVGNFDAMSDGQRLSALTSGAVFWKGAQVVAAKGGQVKMFCPNPQQPGSTLVHWDTSNTPDLLMEPIYTGATSSIDVTKEAFKDMGWTFTAAAVDDWTMY